jgi:hypothetical protein
VQVSKIMKLLDHWMSVPDEAFNKVAIRLGANLVIDAEVGLCRLQVESSGPIA